MNEPVLVTAPDTYDRQWKGTAAADNTNPVIGNVGHHELLGLDDRWVIVGWDFHVGARYTGITAYAVDKQEWDISSREDLLRVCEQRGTVPVVAHNIEWPGSLDEFLGKAFEPMTWQLCSTGTTWGFAFDLVESVQHELPAG